jgi:hypothetical protein
MPPGAGGAMIQQVLQQLMSNPAALQGMQNFMQGAPPTAGMPQPMGGGAPGAMPMPPAGGAPPGMPPMPPGGEPMPEEGMPPGDPEQMATDQIDQAGNTWDGVDAPTKNDIQRLKEDPNEEAIASFDEQFGEGAAEKYLEGEGDSEEEPEGGEAEETDKSSEDDEEY